ncbi:MAG: DNA replication/repair protein RecF [Proteobacteria bacterium]|nr:DNA replication/repair protein RecF [Pseudomonadota bacterium]
MYLENIQVSQFRNIGQAYLEFCPGFNVFYGNNGQGKSNLLEAIYILAYLKGFRGARIAELVMQNTTGAQLSASLDREGAHTLLGVELTGKQRKVWLDRNPCGRLMDYLGVMRVILFVPSDVSLLQAAPSDRRTFIDRMVFNHLPVYLEHLERYTKTLRLKSAELRAEQPNQAMLDVYDQSLLSYGSEIIRARYTYFEKLAPYLRACFASIFDAQFECCPQYMCASGGVRVFGQEAGGMTLDEMLDAYSKKLMSSRQTEIARQQASSGPHRDDWTLVMNGKEARYFASQGQQRAMILALKMAEIAFIKSVVGIEPIFLLDDVSSELDPTRNARLAEYLYALTTQTFLTTTSKNHFQLPSIGKRFYVEGGCFTLDES